MTNDGGKLIALIVVVIVGYLVIQQLVDTEPAQLSFDIQLPIPILEYGNSTKIAVTVSNTGGPAWNARIQLNSIAVRVGSYVPDQTSLGGHKNTNLTVSVSSNDVTNKVYEMQVWISYDDSSGHHDTAYQTVSVYVLPAVEITNVVWEKTGLFDIWPKSTIKQTDSTALNFSVLSRSHMTIYDNLQATIRILNEARGIAISPSYIPIEPIGSGGQPTKPYCFHIYSNNAVVGKYNIQIIITSHGYIAATCVVELTVE
jgi:hypothetical protein